eukprot:9706216-Heterocapsa_arctica.AAC.1
MVYLEADVLPSETINAVKEEKWCLLEWACDEHSRLAAWFVANGHHAVRLGLPGIDLSLKSAEDV